MFMTFRLLTGVIFSGWLAVQTPPGPAPLDLTPLLELADLQPRPVTPEEDEKTGFIVGGKNRTDALAKLTELNGLPIAQLEKSMRPKTLSKSGFLGPDESLLAILAADNRYVVDERGLSHQELARHLHALGTIARWQEHRKQQGQEFLYHGRRFKVAVAHSRGIQPSPFRDGTRSGSNVTVMNLSNGKQVRYGLLVPYMIERYGFYEGKGTPYRLEPRVVLEVLDFLTAKQQPGGRSR